MKYFTALPLAVALASAEMMVMDVAPPAPADQKIHTVIVGGMKPVAAGMAPKLEYTPDNIKANVGDMVVFQFMQKNHTVTQSTFAEPCKKMEGGMDSGFMPNPEGMPGVTWNMTVQTTEPLWFYCKQKNGFHCGKGMVFSINPAETGDKTMADFKGLAIKQNGTDLVEGGLQMVDPGAAAAPTTVGVIAGGGAAAPTGATPPPPPPAAASPPPAQVVAGSGMDGQGVACSCQCLCGAAAFPPSAAINSFGGYAGMIA